MDVPNTHKANPILWKAAILKVEKNAMMYLSNSLTDRYHATLLILPNKTANIIKQNGNQNFVCKILSTEASFYIYAMPLAVVSAIAIASGR